MTAEAAGAGLIRSLRWLGWPYGWAARLRVHLYREGWLRSRRLPRPVISIGNLTVGGTGKTPVVIHVAQWLLASNKRVAILSRGYRRRSRERCLLVSDGHRVLVGSDEAGDEPYLIAQRCPSALVAVGPDRYDLGRWVLERHPVDCFLLDDGYQHLRLRRDLDLLLLDATDSAGIEAMLPVGRLREPLCAASRASALLLTRADAAAQGNPVWSRVRKACPGVADPVEVVFTADELIRVSTGESRGVERFREARAFLFSGIGNARAFHELVRKVGMTVVETAVLSDHVRYDRSLVDTIREKAARARADILVTTEKDAGKLTALLRPDEAWWALRLRVDIPAGRERLERMIWSAAAGDGMEVCA